MEKRIAQTSVILWADRNMTSEMIVQALKAVEQSGVVDWVTFPDHMVNLIPPSLWKPENAPMASVLRDTDSLHHAALMCGIAHAVAPKLKISYAGDPVRLGPAEMTQLIWSLSMLTGGRVNFQFGPGEIKTLKAYGHKRSEGLARFEDLLKVSRALWETDGLIDYKGHHCEMTKAYLGGTKPATLPEIWSMGTGPKQVDMATSLCDGICSCVPCVWTTPERTAAAIREIKNTVREKGRDPDKVTAAAFVFSIAHEDPEVVNRALDNPIIRWLAAMMGRVNPAEWRKEGIEPATPEGWTYFMKFVPYETTPEFVEEVLSKTTREMVEKSFLFGSPAEVAKQLQAHVDAGLEWVGLFDCTSMALEPADAAKGLGRILEICARLKH